MPIPPACTRRSNTMALPGWRLRSNRQEHEDPRLFASFETRIIYIAISIKVASWHACLLTKNSNLQRCAKPPSNHRRSQLNMGFNFPHEELSWRLHDNITNVKEGCTLTILRSCNGELRVHTRHCCVANIPPVLSSFPTLKSVAVFQKWLKDVAKKKKKKLTIEARKYINDRRGRIRRSAFHTRRRSALISSWESCTCSCIKSPLGLRATSSSWFVCLAEISMMYPSSFSLLAQPTEESRSFI